MARERQLITYKGALIKHCQLNFQQKLFRPEGIDMKYSRNEKQGLLYLVRLSPKIEGEIKSSPDKEKLKEFHFHQTNMIRNVKGTSLRRRRRKRRI